jgi:hypothetical protein
VDVYTDHEGNTEYSTAWVKQMRNSRTLTRKRKGKRSLADVGENWKIILKLTLNKSGLKILTGFIWLRIGSSKRDNEPSVSGKTGNLLSMEVIIGISVNLTT